MFILKDLNKKKRLEIKKVCNRIFLETSMQKSRESVRPVNYFAFENEIKPAEFVHAKLFEFEAKEKTEQEPKVFKKNDEKEAENKKKKNASRRDIDRTIVKTQILPELNMEAKRPLDFYKKNLMFTAEVLEEAKTKSESENRNVYEVLFDAVLSILKTGPFYNFKSLKECIGPLDSLKRDKLIVTALILKLKLKKGAMHTKDVPKLGVKNVEKYLKIIGCTINNEFIELINNPKLESKKFYRG